MSNHAWLSASSAHRWMECTAAPKMESDYEDVTTEFAEEGTAAHILAADCLTKQTLDVAKEVDSLGHIVTLDNGKEYPVDNEMITHVQSYVDYISELKFDDSFIEERVDFSRYVKDGFGTVDFASIDVSEKMLTVVDLKYGKGVKVEAANNPQLKLYAIGAVEAVRAYIDIELVKMVVFQPRIDNISTIKVSTKTLEAFGEHVKKISDDIYKNEVKFNPGDHCKFCKAKADCTALAKHVLDKRIDEFTDLDQKVQGKDVTVDIIRKSKSHKLKPEQVSYLLRVAKEVESFFSDLKKNALNKVLEGVPIPGWKAVEGRSIRKWSDEDSVKTILTEEGYTHEDILVTNLISVAQAEKLVGKKKGILAECIVKPPGKPTLVTEDDKRPKYEKPELQFDNLEE